MKNVLKFILLLLRFIFLSPAIIVSVGFALNCYNYYIGYPFKEWIGWAIVLYGLLVFLIKRLISK